MAAMKVKQETTSHLCVLVHGLWGNPSHLDHLVSSLRARYADSGVETLVTKSNSGNFTYDGIELGAERMTKEVEDKLEELESEGRPATKLSMIGYSLGGLVARYAVGILYSKGYFDKLEPVNFTTFATPHLGTRTPMKGFHSRIWNGLGAHFLSQSGRQLFLVDDFRSTGRPLLSVLADPSTTFMRGLTLFKHRTLYANIVNDRAAPYYTTSISATDPYADLYSMDINYLKGHEPLLVNYDEPALVDGDSEDLEPTMLKKFQATSKAVIKGAPTAALLTVFLPIGLLVFLVNGSIQSIQSARRIRLHEEGLAGIGIGSYRNPLLLAPQEMQTAVDGMMRDMAPEHEEFLSGSDSDDREVTTVPLKKTTSTHTSRFSRTKKSTSFPKLALSNDQFKMIDSLNAVGFRKYPVHIQAVGHSHAAIVVRMNRGAFHEGRKVVQHWLDNEFYLS